MKKILHIYLIKVVSILFLLQLTFSGKTYSQNYTEDFNLTFPKKIISNGNYNTINFIDSRSETNDLGFVYSGVENKRTPVVPKTDFNTQFKKLLKNSIDSSTADGELLLQLRKFKFLEKPERASEFGFCLLRADLYLKQDSTYKKLSRIDTIIIVESLDATKPLFEETSNALTEFVLKNLTKDFSNTDNYTFNQIIHIDSLEKNKIKLYNQSQYTDGVYNTFENFKNQIPDFKILEVVYKQEKTLIIKAQNKKNKKIKIRPDEFFAFVNEGKPYISAEYGCYPLEKKDNDFYFIGEGKIPNEKVFLTSETNDSNGVEVNKGPALTTQTAFYQIKLDHIDGSLMRVKEIKK